MEEKSFLDAIAQSPGCDTTRLALADWYAERGELIREMQCRNGPPPLGLFFYGYGHGCGCGYGDADGDGDGYGDGDGDGDGYGYGYGYGHGYGDGDGYGYGYGYGHGYGYGDADGYGHGCGYGYGDGDGDGNGYGYGYGYGDGNDLILTEVKTMPTADGNPWFIVLPHGWVIVGRVTEQTGPYQFRVTDTRLICRTGGTPWDDLCNGVGRNAATYRLWGTVNIGPQFVMSRPWAGELPTVK